MKKMKKIIGVLLICTFVLLSITACSCSSSDYTVTFDLNYLGAAAAEKIGVNDGEPVAEPKDPERSGFMFDGWHTDASCTFIYNFNTPVTSDITLYAKWLDNSKTYYTVTFDLNYKNAPASGTQSVVSGEKVAKPTQNPTFIATEFIEKAEFVKWTTDKAGENDYDFSTSISGNTTLYAQWKTTYIFEAELVQLQGKVNPAGWSGGGGSSNWPIAMVDDTQNLGASGGIYVSWLYRKGNVLEFIITSDRDINDAIITLRLSCEERSITISNDTYKVMKDDEPIIYTPISFTINDNKDALPFEDYVVADYVRLNKGVNTFKLITDNDLNMAGTADAQAPMVDCIKITTGATLSWQPVLSNLEIHNS